MTNSNVHTLSDARRAIAGYVASPGSLAATVGKRFSAAFMLRMSRILSLPEISIVLRAESARERGLASARGGSFAAAEADIGAARSIACDGGLTGPAFLAAETFQLAAEAYLDYRRGHSERARQALLHSATMSARLADDHGFSMDYRIVHLARNIIHVEVAAGDAAGALRAALGLARYIDGDPAGWPFADRMGDHRPSPLHGLERLLSVDEIVGEVAAVHRRNPAAIQAVGRDATAGIDDLIASFIAALADLDRNRGTTMVDLIVRHCRAAEAAMPNTSAAFLASLERATAMDATLR